MFGHCYLILTVAVLLASAWVPNTVSRRTMPYSNNARQLPDMMSKGINSPNGFPAYNRFAGQNTANNFEFTNIGNPGATFENYLNAKFMPNAGSVLSNIIVEPSLANINAVNSMPYGNVATGMKAKALTLNFGDPNALSNGGNGKSGTQNYGFSIMADKLEVGGGFTISGKMPFYSTVSINGNIPTSGTGAVDFRSRPS